MAFNRRYNKSFRRQSPTMPPEFRHRRPQPLYPYFYIDERILQMLYRAHLLQAMEQRQRNQQSATTVLKPQPDYHAVLGVPMTASKEEITTAYRKLAKQYHPDTVENLGSEVRNEAERRMTIINEAYNELK